MISPATTVIVIIIVITCAIKQHNRYRRHRQIICQVIDNEILAQGPNAVTIKQLWTCIRITNISLIYSNG